MVKSTKFAFHGIVLVVFIPTKKLAAIGRQTENLWPFYAIAFVFVHYTPGGLENFVGMRTKNPIGLDHVMYRLDNTKMLEIMFCPPCSCQKR